MTTATAAWDSQNATAFPSQTGVSVEWIDLSEDHETISGLPDQSGTFIIDVPDDTVSKSYPVWDLDSLGRWIEDLVVELPRQVSIEVRNRLSRLLTQLERNQVPGLHQPQVEFDPEGTLDLVWANQGKNRTLRLSIDVEQSEGLDVDAIITDNRMAYDYEGLTEETLRGILSWYSTSDQPWER